jgi:hypothetical protein
MFVSSGGRTLGRKGTLATFWCASGDFEWNASVAVWHGSILFFVRFLGSEGLIGRNCGIASGVVRRGSVLGAWALACREVERRLYYFGKYIDANMLATSKETILLCWQKFLLAMRNSLLP